MPRRRIIWSFYPTYLIITIVALVAVSWYAARELRDLALEQTTSELQARINLIIPALEKSIIERDGARVDSICKTLGSISSTRITVVLPDGKVIGDTDNDPATMDNHLSRPEIADATANPVGIGTRYSNTLHRTMVYLARGLKFQGQSAGFVRVSVPMMSVDSALSPIISKVIVFGFIIAALMGVISLFVARRISRPIEVLKEGAERFARGELDHKLAVRDSSEIGALATAMNEMASNINERIDIITRQKNEWEAILASMVEGVLAVDENEKILNLNKAAADLIGKNSSLLLGKTVPEAIRIPALQKFIIRTLESSQPVEDELILTSNGEKHIQLHGTTLRNSRGLSIGALIVLNDITRIRRLENLRRDFVANVSHELKTPVTSIKGFVETLLDGAVKSPEDAERFLRIIEKQVNRLDNIIRDLLSLSYLERETEKEEIALVPGSIRKGLEDSIEACSGKAAARKIELTLECDDQLSASINQPLFEQAVGNLIDNAINYSEGGKKVEIKANESKESINISVQDHGCGIALEHLPRIFERFYRVDTARSRSQGGTGLGLSIVKHIIQAHRGTVTVVSTYGEGSIFTIKLPRSGV